MTKWIVKQESQYIEMQYDEFEYPGPVTFFSPASPEEGFFNDRELDPQEVAEILMRFDEIVKIMEGIA